uniref:Photosystem I subunit VII n=1 Tax=Batophora occidentalis TaxID=35849 RepID=A0A386JLR3_9CHLO|nr:photosystem I subunit VII [Batophora occidentalis]
MKKKIKINTLIPYYELFQHLNTLVHLKNQLGKQIHNVYTQHNLQFLALTQFVLLYIHPKEPFLKHPLDKHEHIVYIQYKYDKF